ncbi:hypothetical protein SmJEL517_g05523 [Synchytrium microbalum]|uniref:Uncharacterized protein n=1 Tax=Synchytrium microbalum TaxID=1806994 RepID=A0A507BZA0_9FUNG|nr:uncharacterized protein SmJEL517_g05523 [Synchytrium microbalum]TPX31076.1 hypothetical protein SmJEL517_g05523 [Synchytrium microbalum]
MEEPLQPQTSLSNESTPNLVPHPVSPPRVTGMGNGKQMYPNDDDQTKHHRAVSPIPDPYSAAVYKSNQQSELASESYQHNPPLSVAENHDIASHHTPAVQKRPPVVEYEVPIHGSSPEVWKSKQKLRRNLVNGNDIPDAPHSPPYHDRDHDDQEERETMRYLIQSKIKVDDPNDEDYLEGSSRRKSKSRSRSRSQSRSHRGSPAPSIASSTKSSNRMSEVSNGENKSSRKRKRPSNTGAVVDTEMIDATQNDIDESGQTVSRDSPPLPTDDADVSAHQESRGRPSSRKSKGHESSNRTESPADDQYSNNEDDNNNDNPSNDSQEEEGGTSSARRKSASGISKRKAKDDYVRAQIEMLQKFEAQKQAGTSSSPPRSTSSDKAKNTPPSIITSDIAEKRPRGRPPGGGNSRKNSRQTSPKPSTAPTSPIRGESIKRSVPTTPSGPVASPPSVPAPKSEPIPPPPSSSSAKGPGSSPPRYPPVQSRDPKAGIRLGNKIVPYSAINTIDRAGRTHIHKYAELGDADTCLILINAGADINIRDHAGWSPLHEACLNGHDKVVSLLIRYGADPNSLGSGGDTPLHDAVENRHSKVVDILLAHGASMTTANNAGKLPRDLVEASDALRSVLDAWEEWLPKVSEKDDTGRTLLHKAAASGDMVLFKNCIKYGSDVASVDYAGNTPLHEAANDGEKEVVTELLKYGANPNAASNTGDTPLHVAVVNGYTEVVESILKHGGNAVLTNHDGKTPRDLIDGQITSDAEWTAMHTIKEMLDRDPESWKPYIKPLFRAQIVVEHQSGDSIRRSASLQPKQEASDSGTAQSKPRPLKKNTHHRHSRRSSIASDSSTSIAPSNGNGSSVSANQNNYFAWGGLDPPRGGFESKREERKFQMLLQQLGETAKPAPSPQQQLQSRGRKDEDDAESSQDERRRVKISEERGRSKASRTRESSSSSTRYSSSSSSDIDSDDEGDDEDATMSTSSKGHKESKSSNSAKRPVGRPPKKPSKPSKPEASKSISKSKDDTLGKRRERSRSPDLKGKKPKVADDRKVKKEKRERSSSPPRQKPAADGTDRKKKRDPSPKRRRVEDEKKPKKVAPKDSNKMDVDMKELFGEDDDESQIKKVKKPIASERKPSVVAALKPAAAPPPPPEPVIEDLPVIKKKPKKSWLTVSGYQRAGGESTLPPVAPGRSKPAASGPTPNGVHLAKDDSQSSLSSSTICPDAYFSRPSELIDAAALEEYEHKHCLPLYSVILPDEPNTRYMVDLQVGLFLGLPSGRQFLDKYPSLSRRVATSAEKSDLAVTPIAEATWSCMKLRGKTKWLKPLSTRSGKEGLKLGDVDVQLVKEDEIAAVLLEAGALPGSQSHPWGAWVSSVDLKTFNEGLPNAVTPRTDHPTPKITVAAQAAAPAVDSSNGSAEASSSTAAPTNETVASTPAINDVANAGNNGNSGGGNSGGGATTTFATFDLHKLKKRGGNPTA